MDKQSDPPPSGEGSEQLGSSAAANPPSNQNLPFGGSANVILDQTAIPQIINPYAAAAAAIALAHQQMAQSLQANAMGLSQQPNGAFIQPISTNPSAQTSQEPSDAPPTNSSASISSSISHGSTNNASNQNGAQEELSCTEFPVIFSNSDSSCGAFRWRVAPDGHYQPGSPGDINGPTKQCSATASQQQCPSQSNHHIEGSCAKSSAEIDRSRRSTNSCRSCRSSRCGPCSRSIIWCHGKCCLCQYAELETGPVRYVQC